MSKYTLPEIDITKYTDIQTKMREISLLRKSVEAKAKEVAQQVFYFETINLPKQEKQELNQYIRLIEIMLIKAFSNGAVLGKYIQEVEDETI